MLNVQTAFTPEIDDVDKAVTEIIEQLNLDALGKYRIGIIAALPAFLETGVVAALQEALPFDLVGQTTIATSLCGSDNLDQLSIMVLSSDTIEFSIYLSTPIDGQSADPIKSAHLKATAPYEQKPSFILSYVPLSQTASGDFFIKNLDTISGGVPIFGGVTVDDTLDYHNSQVIYKGKGYSDQMACVLFYGDVRPRFFLATITYGKVFEETGLVTGSTGSLLRTIDGAPVSEFLKSVGIKPNEDGEFVGINTYPYLVDYNDGSDPVIKIMFAVTAEGYAACGGDIPEGALLTVSIFDSNEILGSSKATISNLAEDVKENGANLVLAYSCVGRYFSLGVNAKAEVELLEDALSNCDVPYVFTYCGGELCPVGNKDDSSILTNRAHNSTFIAVVL